MSEPKAKSVAAPPQNFGWMAEYTDEASLLTAARKVRDSGYTKTDAFTPFPVHGIDEALGIKPTVLPWIVICCGFTGLATAAALQYWTNAIDYKYIISGKPFGSWPAFIPVMFELTILFSAFSTFLGMWALNGLPCFSNPVFTNPRFDRVTDDRFFLHVDSRDKYFNRESVKAMLASTSPESLDEVIEDSTPSVIPREIWLGLLLLFVASLVPAAIVLNMRASNDSSPRWHVFFDMDFQPKKKSQQRTTLFADGRTSRPQILGTVARGSLIESDPFYLGYDPSKQASMSSKDSVKFIAVQDESAKETGATDSGAKEPSAESTEAKVEETAKATSEEKEVSAAEATGTDAKPDSEPDMKAKSESKPEEPAPKDVTKDAPAAEPTAAASTPPVNSAVAAPAPVAPIPNLPWISEFPMPVSSDVVALGKTKFETYCSACHGYAGDGDGLVHRRAEKLQQPYWLPPTSLHEKRIQDQAIGNIFYTISNGKGKMASYGAVLSPKERWAVVAYVRALQLSRNATMEDIPPEQRAKIEEITTTK